MASEKILTLKPLFAGLMRKSTKDRSRAVILRRYLINAEIDYAMLLQAYENGSGSEESVSAVISKTTAVNREKVSSSYKKLRNRICYCHAIILNII